jgi:hypothetical protein
VGGSNDRIAVNVRSTSNTLVHFEVNVLGNLLMTDDVEKRGQLIRHLEDALALADEIEDGQTGYLIERALDEARSRQFRPIG